MKKIEVVKDILELGFKTTEFENIWVLETYAKEIEVRKLKQNETDGYKWMLTIDYYMAGGLPAIVFREDEEEHLLKEITKALS
jgi:hypothetical protein